MNNNHQAPQAAPPAPAPAPVYLDQLFHHRHRNPIQSALDVLRNDYILRQRIAAACLVIIFLLGCMIFMLWMTIRPNHPEMHVTSYHLTHLNFTAGDGYSAACNISLLITNPNNRLTIFYDNLDLFLYYSSSGAPLSSVEIPPFAQPNKNGTFLHSHLEFFVTNVTKDVLKKIKDDFDYGSVSFQIKVLGLMRYAGKEWKSKPALATFYCQDVAVHFAAFNGTGEILHPYQQCLFSF